MSFSFRVNGRPERTADTILQALYAINDEVPFHASAAPPIISAFDCGASEVEIRNERGDRIFIVRKQ